MAVLSEIEAPSHERSSAPAAHGPCSSERLSISSLLSCSEVQRTRGINSLCPKRPKERRAGAFESGRILNYKSPSTVNMWFMVAKMRPADIAEASAASAGASPVFWCWKLQVIARDVFFGPNNARLYTRGVSLLKCVLAADGFMPPWRRCLFIYFELMFASPIRYTLAF